MMNGDLKPDLSIVLPVHNEEGNLHELYGRLVRVLRDAVQTYEIVFVDDGSHDSSYAILEELHKNDPCVKVVKFSRNFGHHVALTAGMDESTGDRVIIMDSDLQDMPEEIPNFLKKMDEGYDVVHGVRINKQHSTVKKLTSWLFIALMNKIIDARYPFNNGIYKAMSRPFIDQLIRFRECDRFLVGLIGYVGFKQTSIDVQHGARFAGEPSYRFRSIVKLGTDALLGYTFLPLRITSFIGYFIAISCMGVIGWLIMRKIIWDLGVTGWTSLMIMVLFLGGLQLICLGIIGEYIARIYTETKRRPLYIVETRLGHTSPDQDMETD